MLTKAQKEILKENNHTYYFLFKNEVPLSSLYKDSIINSMVKNSKIKNFILKNHPNFISLLNSSQKESLDLVKKDYYKYDPTLFFLNKNPNFDDLIEVNKSILFELTYNYFLFFHGYTSKKEHNLKLLNKIVNHYFIYNKLSDKEKDIILTINPYLGLTKFFITNKHHVDLFVQNNSNNEISNHIIWNSLADDIENFLFDRSYVLMNNITSDFKSILLPLLNNCDKFCSFIFPDFFTDAEVIVNFNNIFLSKSPENALFLTFEDLPSKIQKLIFNNESIINSIYDYLKSNPDHVVDVIANANGEMIYSKNIYLQNIHWLKLLTLLQPQPAVFYLHISCICEVEELLMNLLKSSKKTDPIFLSTLYSYIPKLPLNKDIIPNYLKKIKKSKYWKDDAGLLIYTIQKEQNEENLIKIQNLINSKKLELKDSNLILKDFLMNLDLNKESIPMSEFIKMISKLI